MPNLRRQFWYGDARETGATSESIYINLRHRWGNDGILTPAYQRIALRMDYGIAILSRVIDLVVLGNGNAREAGAITESPVPNLRHRWGDGDASEAGATTESIFPNLLHPARQGYTFKVLTTIESPILNLLHPFGKSDLCEVLATIESLLSNLLYPQGKFHASEFFAILESPLLYLCLPFGYDGLAILDIVAVFFVSCHSSGFRPCKYSKIMRNLQETPYSFNIKR